MIYVNQIFCIIITCSMLFGLYIFIGENGNDLRYDETKTIYDYEGVLCKFRSEPNYRKYISKIRCPKKGIITSFTPSGLSTNMWQYANIYAGSMTTGLDGYMPSCLKDILEDVFDKLSLPSLSRIGHCIVALPEAVTSIDDWSDHDQSIVIWDTNLYNHHVLTNLNKIMKDFVFHKALSEYANDILLSAINVKAKVTYIGMYITNTNIIAEQNYDGVYPSVQFFLDSMAEYRKQFSNAFFIIVTDHELFWASVLSKHRNVHIMSEGTLVTVENILSVLAHCNHSILSSENIAVWGALLAGGRVILSLSLSSRFNEIVQLRDGLMSAVELEMKIIAHWVINLKFDSRGNMISIRRNFYGDDITTKDFVQIQERVASLGDNGMDK